MNETRNSPKQNVNSPRHEDQNTGETDSDDDAGVNNYDDVGIGIKELKEYDNLLLLPCFIFFVSLSIKPRYWKLL